MQKATENTSTADAIQFIRIAQFTPPVTASSAAVKSTTSTTRTSSRKRQAASDAVWEQYSDRRSKVLSLSSKRSGKYQDLGPKHLHLTNSIFVVGQHVFHVVRRKSVVTFGVQKPTTIHLVNAAVQVIPSVTLGMIFTCWTATCRQTQAHRPSHQSAT